MSFGTFCYGWEAPLGHSAFLNTQPITQHTTHCWRLAIAEWVAFFACLPVCRQGNDVGPQYRSIILYTSEDQKAVAEEVMAEVTKGQWYSDPLVTELVPLERLWNGEGYHQNYYNDNPNQGYCKVVVGPKVAKFRSKFFQKLVK